MIVGLRWLSAYKKSFITLMQGTLIGLLGLLVGCVSIATKPADISIIVTEPVAIAENLSSAPFRFIGRISVQDEEQRFSGGLRWQHSGSNNEIFLLSPLGQVVAHIIQDDDIAQLITSEQKVFTAPDIEMLTQEILGWQIPVAGLQYWVRGEHYPATVAILHVDSDGRTVMIKQDGWEISYTSFFSAQSVQPPRPRVLSLNYQNVKIKLVVDKWVAV